jgi:hypothetical protein
MFLKKAVMKKNIIPALVFSFMFFNGVFVRSEMMDDHGRIEIVSKDLVADAPGELILRYHAGAAGVPEEWSVWVELPSGWYNHCGCPRSDRILKWQFVNPEKNGFCRARAVPEGLKIIYRAGSRADIYGAGNRFVQVFAFQVRDRPMGPGETMDLVFHHKMKQGKPHAPLTAGSGQVKWLVESPDEKVPEFNMVAARTSREGQGDGLPGEEWLQVAAGPPAVLLVNIPSRASVGDTAPVRVRTLDANYNFCETWSQTPKVSVTGPAALMPGPVGSETPGVWEALLKINGTGVVTVTAEVKGLGREKSNPLEVIDDSSHGIYWGDLHSHSRWSHDGMGVHPVKYARDASALEFFAITEHVRSTTDREWRDILKTNLDNNLPGRFVTVPAMEDSAFGPSGHFNLFFRQDEPPKLIPDQFDGIERMYGGLHPAVVQHHTGILWSEGRPWLKWTIPIYGRLPGAYVDWKQHRHVNRAAIEIYSLHGSSEMYDPRDLLSYEHVDLIMPTAGRDIGVCRTGMSNPGPRYARDAWAEGLLMGAASGSDDHRAQPGKRAGGLTAVMAKELTRDAVLDAIHKRRIYATTGDRIILDFRINGRVMGSVIEPSSKINVKIHAIGTAPVALIQVMRYDWESNTWKVVVEERPGAVAVDLEKSLGAPLPSVYYLRLEQEGLVNHRPVRAWSSPIWVGEPPMYKD